MTQNNRRRLNEVSKVTRYTKDAERKTCDNLRDAKLHSSLPAFPVQRQRQKSPPRGNSGGPGEKTGRLTLKISSETSLDSKSATDFSTAEILVSTGQDAQFLPSVI